MKKSRLWALLTFAAGAILCGVCFAFVFSYRSPSRVPAYWLMYTAFSIATAISGLFCLIFNKTVTECCTLKTSAVAFLISICSGVGLSCSLYFLDCMLSSIFDSGKHPLRLPTSFAGTAIGFVASLVLLSMYVALRKKSPSKKGVLIDVIFSIIYMPTFWLLVDAVFNILTYAIGEKSMPWM